MTKTFCDVCGKELTSLEELMYIVFQLSDNIKWAMPH